MKSFLCPVLLLGGLLSACETDNLDADGLVRATQKGNNTGDFLLNGQPFGPHPPIASPATNPVGASRSDHASLRDNGRSEIYISLFRQDADRRERLLSLHLAGLKSPGTYALTDRVTPIVIPGRQSGMVYAVPGVFPAIRKEYVTGPAFPGRVIVTRFDTVARVVSGTFEATLREYDGPEIITVTKGRFDCSF